MDTLTTNIDLKTREKRNLFPEMEKRWGKKGFFPETETKYSKGVAKARKRRWISRKLNFKRKREKGGGGGGRLKWFSEDKINPFSKVLISFNLFLLSLTPLFHYYPFSPFLNGYFPSLSLSLSLLPLFLMDIFSLFLSFSVSHFSPFLNGCK